MQFRLLVLIGSLALALTACSSPSTVETPAATSPTPMASVSSATVVEATPTPSPTPVVPPRVQFEKQKNPVAAEAASLSRGEKLYRKNCASCHGLKGEGDGPAASTLTPRPRNYLKEKFKFGDTDSAIFATIMTGSPGTAMAPWYGKLTAPQAWDIVNYVQHTLRHR